MEESRLMRSMLLDYYGEILTDKQRECYDLHYNEDLSLAEIAEQLGISRQGVWDNIRRAEAALESMEEKTGLIARFAAVQQSMNRLHDYFAAIRDNSTGAVRKLALDGMEELEKARHTI